MNWCVLIPAIVGLVCAVLVYLLGRLLSGGKTDNIDWESKYLSAENDLSHCKDKLSAASIEIKALTTLSTKSAIAPIATIPAKVKPKSKITKTTTKSAKATPKVKPKVAKTAPKAKATPADNHGENILHNLLSKCQKPLATTLYKYFNPYIVPPSSPPIKT